MSALQVKCIALWDAVFYAVCSGYILHILTNVVDNWVFCANHKFACCAIYIYYVLQQLKDHFSFSCPFFSYFSHNENILVCLFHLPLSHSFRWFLCLRPVWLIWPRWRSWFHTAGEATTPPCWWESCVHLPRSSQITNKICRAQICSIYFPILSGGSHLLFFCCCFFVDNVMLDKILSSTLPFLRIWI